MEKGTYRVGVGADVDCRQDPTSSLCATFELTLSANYNGKFSYALQNTRNNFLPCNFIFAAAVCDTACSIWSHGVCGLKYADQECQTLCREQKL
jgi:hypothetical protein